MKLVLKTLLLTFVVASCNPSTSVSISEKEVIERVMSKFDAIYTASLIDVLVDGEKHRYFDLQISKIKVETISDYSLELALSKIAYLLQSEILNGDVKGVRFDVNSKYFSKYELTYAFEEVEEISKLLRVVKTIVALMKDQEYERIYSLFDERTVKDTLAKALEFFQLLDERNGKIDGKFHWDGYVKSIDEISGDSIIEFNGSVSRQRVFTTMFVVINLTTRKPIEIKSY